MFIVFDLDGTLCKIDHRLHFIQGRKKNFDAFYDACGDDAPNTPIINIFRDLMAGNQVQIWSGRSDRVRLQTEQWLQRHEISPGHLTRMRKAGDYTPDHELKRSWLENQRQNNGPVPTVIFDDRQRVVDMWREEGLTCCQVDQWIE
jgi:FMN phosphatase YigB (HAD superfamily)